MKTKYTLVQRRSEDRELNQVTLKPYPDYIADSVNKRVSYTD